MSSAANKMQEGMRKLSVLLLLFALVSGAITCPAMAWTPIAPEHPCCPHSQNPDSNRCAKIGCIGTAPVLAPNEDGSMAPVLAVAAVEVLATTKLPTLEWALEPVLDPPEFALFLVHHQLLI